MNNLQRALLMAADKEVQQYELLMVSEPDHSFSQRYRQRRVEVIHLSEREGTSVNKIDFRSVRRLSARTILVAALIMVLTTLSVIAIAKPHIYYVVKERIDSWNITFTQEGADESTQNADDVEFILHRPQIPDGFSIRTEGFNGPFYFLEIEAEDGRWIMFDQHEPEGVSISLDSERNDVTKETICGYEVIIQRQEGKINNIICNDGDYIYMIGGNDLVEEDLLLQMMESVLTQ